MHRNHRDAITAQKQYVSSGYCWRPVFASALAFAFFLSASIVQAGPLSVLNPGGAVNPVGAIVPVGGGVIIAQTQSAFSSPTGAFYATLTTTVVAGDATNPYGGYDFIYQLSNAATSTDSLERLTVNNFAGYFTDVGYQTPIAVGSILPSKITRSSGAVNQGATIGFRFDPGSNGVIDPGKSTVIMVVQTDAHNYQSTYASVINSERTDLPSYGPAITVPEPSSLVLAGFGVVGLIAFARRRRK